jgi:hypothetical protein
MGDLRSVASVATSNRITDAEHSTYFGTSKRRHEVLWKKKEKEKHFSGPFGCI